MPTFADILRNDPPYAPAPPTATIVDGEHTWHVTMPDEPYSDKLLAQWVREDGYTTASRTGDLEQEFDPDNGPSETAWEQWEQISLDYDRYNEANLTKVQTTMDCADPNAPWDGEDFDWVPYITDATVENYLYSEPEQDDEFSLGPIDFVRAVGVLAQWWYPADDPKQEVLKPLAKKSRIANDAHALVEEIRQAIS